MTWCDIGCYDYCRASHMPKDIRVLFVGESPPAGGNFFYFGVGNLFVNTMTAFQNAFGIIFPAPGAFLAFFRDCGCYLEDLIPIPGLDVDTCRTMKFPSNYPFPTLLDWYIERFQCCWLDNPFIRPLVIIVVVKRVFKELKRKFDKHSVVYVPISDGKLKLKDAWEEKSIIVFTDDNGEGPLPFPAHGWQKEYVERLEKNIKKA